jgi:hypothetical protein
MHFEVFGLTRYSNLNSCLVMALHEMILDYKGYGKPLYIPYALLHSLRNGTWFQFS